MAELRLKDGTTISVPDGATPDQVKSILAARQSAQREESASQAAKDEWEQTPWYEKALIGAGQSFVEVGRGLGLADEADEATEGSITGLAQGVGGVGADLAMMALPGGAATKVAKYAPKLAKAAPLIGDVVASAGLEAARAGEGSRLQGAAMGGGGALVGGGLANAMGRAGRRLVGGMTPTREAAEMMGRDLPLTPGMAAGEGSAARWVERKMSALPVIGSRVAKQQREVLDQWNTNLMDDVIKNVRDGGLTDVTISAPGNKGFNELSTAFNEAYTDIWEMAAESVNLPKSFHPQINSVITQAGKNLPREAAERVGKTINFARAQFERVARNPLAKDAPDYLDNAYHALRKSAYNAGRKGDVLEAQSYNDALKAIHESLDPLAVQALQITDDAYSKFKVLERAANYKDAMDAGGVFTPANLSAAVRSQGAKSAVAKGRAPLQREAALATEVIDKLVPGGQTFGELATLPAVGIGAMVDPVTTGTLGTVGYMASGPAARKAIMGQTAPQELLQAIGARPDAQVLAEYLRRYVPGARVGGSVATTPEKKTKATQPLVPMPGTF